MRGGICITGVANRTLVVSGANRMPELEARSHSISDWEKKTARPFFFLR